MSVLWVVPMIVLCVGAAAAVVAVRQTADAAEELVVQAEGLAELSRETAALRADVHEAVARGQVLRHGAAEPPG